MSARTTLRASDFVNPETAARRVGQVLASLREEIGSGRTLADLRFSTDASGNVPAISIAPPSWPVKGVVPVYAWDLTTNVAAFLRCVGSYSSGKLSVSVNAGDVSPSRDYVLRLELLGE